MGLAALINSLRLVGHDEPIYVGDCGFTELHRRRLAEHVTLVATAGARAPHFAKTVAPREHPSGVIVLVDADIIVTRPLRQLVDAARPRKIVAFVDRVAGRFDERWAQLLELGPLRRQPYVNSGIVVAERELGLGLLAQVAAGCDRIDVERTLVANGHHEYPFYYLDQDVFNAVLGTYPAESLEFLEHRLAPFPPFSGLRIVDEARLRCAYADGVEPFALHHVLRKPWISATRWSIYAQLLARLVLADDVPLPLRREELPWRLRNGPFGWVEKRRSDALSVVRGMRGRLGLRRRLADRRRA